MSAQVQATTNQNYTQESIDALIDHMRTLLDLSQRLTLSRGDGIRCQDRISSSGVRRDNGTWSWYWMTVHGVNQGGEGNQGVNY